MLHSPRLPQRARRGLIDLLDCYRAVALHAGKKLLPVGRRRGSVDLEHRETLRLGGGTVLHERNRIRK